MQGPAFFGLAGSEGTDGRSIHDRSADVLMHTSRSGSGNGVLRQERLSAVRYAPRAPRRDDPVKGPKRRPADHLPPPRLPATSPFALRRDSRSSKEAGERESPSPV